MLSSRNLRIFRNHPSVDGKSAFNRIELRLGLESHEFVGFGLCEIRGQWNGYLEREGKALVGSGWTRYV